MSKKIRTVSFSSSSVFPAKFVLKDAVQEINPCGVTDGIDIGWIDLPPCLIPAGCHLAAAFDTCSRHGPAKNLS